VRQIRGALGLAERAFQQVIQYARETLGEHTFLLGMPYISFADLLREQNRFEEAIRYAGQGIAYCQMWQPMASMDGHIALARIHAARGGWDEAYACLQQALQVAEGSASILDDSFVAIHMVRLELLRGDLSRAQHLIDAYDFAKRSDGMYYHLWELVQLVLLRARVLAFQAEPRDPGPLLQALSDLIDSAERRERVTPVIEALLLRAYAQHAAAQHAAAAESLSRALTAGAQSGYRRIFADEGRQLLHLLDRYLNQLHGPRLYLQEILEILRRESGAAGPAQAPASQALVPLTRRELDILQLLAAGRSNQEIAAERVLTLNTVKKHVANILSKLGAANRTQAVMFARQRGWLE
jgi:LuxR family maltose regulon positive regulatory protein